MIIESIYPNKISLYDNLPPIGWVSNSGTPISSGDIQYLNKSASASGVDSTYIWNKGFATSLELRFNSSISSLSNNVESAVLRIRTSVPTTPIGSSVYFTGYNQYNLTGNHSDVPYILNYNTPLNSGVKHLNIDFYDNPIALFQNLEYISGSGFTTKDISINPNVFNNIDLYKDLVININTLPSGTQLSTASIILSGNPSNGLPINIVGDTEQDHSERRIQSMELDGKANYRAWGRDASQVSPTGFFSYYNDFSIGNGLSTSEYNGCRVKDFYTGDSSSLVPVNTYNGIINGTNKYQRGLHLIGSGTYPGSYGLELSYSDMVSSDEAFTIYTAFNSIGSNKTILRLGKETGASNFVDSMIFSVVDSNGVLVFNFYNTSNVWNTRLINTGITNPFSLNTTDSPTRILISYSGQSLLNAYQPSGTFNFYIEDKEAKQFKYAGRVSEKIGSNWVYPIDWDMLGNRDYGFLAASQTANNFVSELGIALYTYVSGIKTVNGIQCMDDSRFERLVTDRHHLERFIATSGDSKYIDIKIPNIINSSGTMVEDVLFSFPSGNHNSLQFVAPFESHIGHYVSNANAVYIEYNVDIFTNHPSGVDLIFNLNTSFNGNSGIISFESLNIPSGNSKYALLSNPKIYGYSDTQPIFFEAKGTPYFSTLDLNVIVKQHSQSIQTSSYPTEVKLDYVKIYMDNVVVSSTGNDELTLYTSGGYPSYNDSVDLYLEAHEHSTNSLDLYMMGYSSNNNNLPLFIKNTIPSNSGMDLYMYGTDIKNTTIPFYLQSQVGVSNSGAVNLYMLGTTNSGITNSTPFFMMASGIYDDRVIPLYLQGGSLEESSDITLFIKHENEWAGNNFELFLKGPSGQNSGIPLYIRGDGTSSGYIPSNDSINFYISRERDDSTDERLRLYMSGPNESVQSTPFYVAGVYIQSSSIPLHIEGSPISNAKNVKMYTHGF